MWSVLWLFVLEAVVVVAGNAFTIVIFTTSNRLRTRQNALIVSLAVADLLVGLVSLPMFVVYRADQEARYSTLFKSIYYAEDSLCGSASLFGLAALAVERAHATYFPFKHNILSNVPYIVGIVVVWVLAGIIVLPYVFSLDKDVNLQVKMITIAITLMIISSAYFLIFVNVRCKTTVSHYANHQSNKKLTVTLAIVTTISLVTWVPYQFMVLYIALSQDKLVGYYYYYYSCKFLHYGNSLVNLIVYSFRMRDFKVELLRRFGYNVGNQIFPNHGIELSNSNTGRSHNGRQTDRSQTF